VRVSSRSRPCSGPPPPPPSCVRLHIITARDVLRSVHREWPLPNEFLHLSHRFSPLFFACFPSAPASFPFYSKPISRPFQPPFSTFRPSFDPAAHRHMSEVRSAVPQARRPQGQHRLADRVQQPVERPDHSPRRGPDPACRTHRERSAMAEQGGAACQPRRVKSQPRPLGVRMQPP
jgi:hypothetical protein